MNKMQGLFQEQIHTLQALLEVSQHCRFKNMILGLTKGKIPTGGSSSQGSPCIGSNKIKGKWGKLN